MFIYNVYLDKIQLILALICDVFYCFSIQAIKKLRLIVNKLVSVMFSIWIPVLPPDHLQLRRQHCGQQQQQQQRQ